MNVTTPLSLLCWATRGQDAVPISHPYQGYDIIQLLPCGPPVLGRARGVNPNRKCWCPSSIDTRRSLGSTGRVERGAYCLDSSSSSIHPVQATWLHWRGHSSAISSSHADGRMPKKILHRQGIDNGNRSKTD